jgi:hypothetical protein
MSANLLVVPNQKDAHAGVSYGFQDAQGADANGAGAMNSVEPVEHFTGNLCQNTLANRLDIEKHRRSIE